MCGSTFGHPSYTQHHKVHFLGIVFSDISVVSVVIVTSNYCCCRSVLYETNTILLCFDISHYFSPVNLSFFCQQIQKVVIALGDFMSAQCHACIGGTNVREDMRKLDMGVHVVVGTPGRVYDMISRRALSKLLVTCQFINSLAWFTSAY